DIDALHLAKFADEDEVACVRRNGDGVEFGGRQAIMDNGVARPAYANLVVEGAPGERAFEDQRVGDRHQALLDQPEHHADGRAYLVVQHATVRGVECDAVPGSEPGEPRVKPSLCAMSVKDVDVEV